LNLNLDKHECFKDIVKFMNQIKDVFVKMNLQHIAFTHASLSRVKIYKFRRVVVR